MDPTRVIHLVTTDVSVLMVQRGALLPTIAHWGRRLTSELGDLRAFAEAGVRSGIDGVSDLPYEPSLLPEHTHGWGGRPGLSVHRGGVGWSPRLALESIDVDGRTVHPGTPVQSGPGTVSALARDDHVGITVVCTVELTVDGLLRTGATIRSDRSDAEPLDVSGVSLALAVPPRAHEVLDFAGRWATEKMPQRHRVVVGTHTRESRRGRTGLDATGTLAVGVPGFDAGAGDVWLCHVGIGGNHEHALERTDGHLAFRGGELLFPGEVRLTAGEEYRTPWVYGSWGDGLDAAAHRYHGFLRRRSRAARRPRPVTCNVWEAVHFEHDLPTLTALASQAAALGVERFVLDDGWFRGRRDDRAGLGDWTPDPVVWPEGLTPLARHVAAEGMELGLWVEPEMINEDSDLARAHPDWVLRARPEALPARQRHQQLLDLTNPDAFAHILAALDTLVTDLDLAYLKWDHNRDLVDAGHPGSGGAAVAEQTRAVYALMDELRSRHPDLEIESCASGGGRVDLGILERTDRVHTSDNHDPLDRVRMLRWTGLLVPPEMLGSHVASATSEATGRTYDLHTRCAAAFLGHFGVEWDLRVLDEADRSELTRWIAAYRDLRGLIATGRVVGAGDFDPDAPSVRGVVAEDGSEGVFTVVTPALSADSRRQVRLPGLATDQSFRLEVAQPPSLAPPWLVPAWLRQVPPLGGSTPGSLAFCGDLLTVVGLDVPTFHRERVLVIRALSTSSTLRAPRRQEPGTASDTARTAS
ncbi:alpha-galactosidase [Cellulomonas bogoriensis]|uniref:Alpha-galactosidase n=1 Tax=Cellulomonas bogoriensis 69B4 = DSM 16987 TaxID=1386082 RepID=A0A0A0BY96_9CELL|nr:alpha-galactosidase [Cellulomonas bogoriensis]KGM12940.1 alpha-galactosidase [Cellulomonas bogoriensis 69B4 = DSM 16987]